MTKPVDVSEWEETLRNEILSKLQPHCPGVELEIKRSYSISEQGPALVFILYWQGKSACDALSFYNLLQTMEEPKRYKVFALHLANRLLSQCNFEEFKNDNFI